MSEATSCPQTLGLPQRGAKQIIRVQMALHQRLSAPVADQRDGLLCRRTMIGHVHDLYTALVLAHLGRRGRDRPGIADEYRIDQRVALRQKRAAQGIRLVGTDDCRGQRRQGLGPRYQFLEVPVPLYDQPWKFVAVVDNLVAWRLNLGDPRQDQRAVLRSRHLGGERHPKGRLIFVGHGHSAQKFVADTRAVVEVEALGVKQGARAR